MNNDFKEYLENARESFQKHIEIMKPSLYSKDRVCMENIILAYDQMFETLKQYELQLIKTTETLTDIDSTLFHHNHAVVGWHLNGDYEPMMNFVSDFNMEVLNENQSLIDEKIMSKKQKQDEGEKAYLDERFMSNLHQGKVGYK
jgi:hypothetical protein